MTESKRRPRSLKGAVLIMVVTILFILIVMLLATLAVVSSSTQRTYTKYAETQAYYSARSVLDVYLGTTLSNTDVVTDSVVANNIITAMKQHFADVSYDDGTGTAVSGLKKVGSNYQDFADEDATKGFAHQQEIFGYLVPKYQWDSTGIGSSNVKDDSNWKLNTNYESDVNAGNEDKYYVTYTVTTPDLSSGVAKTGAGSFSEDNKVELKIELLRILYCNSAGDIITDNVGYSEVTGVSDPAGSILYTYVQDPTDPNFDKMVNWNNTYYRIKVTATANMRDKANGNDNKVSVSVMLEPKIVIERNIFRNALTSIDGTSSSQKMYTIGGASAKIPGGMFAQGNNAQSVGSHVYNSSVSQNTGLQQWKMSANESFVVYGGWLDLANKTAAPTSLLSGSELTNKDVRPYIYAEGVQISNGDDYPIGSSSGPVDIITTYHGSGTIIDPEGNSKQFYGLYNGQWNNKTDAVTTHVQVNPYWGYDATVIEADNSSGASIVNDSACTNYGITDDDEKKKVALFVGPNGAEFFGDVYCDGNMVLGPQGAKFHGNIYCTGNIYYKNDPNGISKMQFDGQIYAKNFVDSAGNATTNIAGVSNSNIAGSTSFNAQWDDSAVQSDKEHKLTITLGASCPGGRTEVRVSSTEDITDGYRDSTGAIVSAEDKFKNDIGEPSAETLAVSVPDDKRIKLNSAVSATSASAYGSSFHFVETLNGVDYEVPASGAKYIDLTDPSVSVVKGSVYEVLLDGSFVGNNNNDTYIFDTKGKKIKMQIKGAFSNSCPKIVIYGTVPKTDAQIAAMGTNAGDTDSLKNPSDVFITVDTSSYVSSAQGLSINNVQIYDMVNNGKTMYVGEQVPAANVDTPEPPKINWYMGAGSFLEWQNGDNTNFSGYIYAPQAYLNAKKACNKSVNVNYNGYGINPVTCVAFYGSAVFKAVQQDTDSFGCIYIKPASGAGKGGAGTNIFWENKVYLNR